MVEVDERAEELAAILIARGYEVTVDGAVLLLGAAEGIHDAVRDAVADLGIGLRRLGPRGRARGRLPGGRWVTDARIFDLGYRSYEGGRERPVRAIATLAVFTARRVLGLGRGARHKVLPAVTLAIAYLPALVSVAFAVILEDLPVDDLISYGDYAFITGSALALFARSSPPRPCAPIGARDCSASTSPARSIATATSWRRV